MKIPENNKEIAIRKAEEAFPTAIRADVAKGIDFLLTQNFTIQPASDFTVILDGAPFTIPKRIYADEPDIDTGQELTELQQVILNCLYLLHNNGYVRQARLKLLRSRTEYFIMPFIFNLTGEYVEEILSDINSMIDDNTLSVYSKFIRENPVYFKKTEDRINNYWHLYYRKTKYEDYAGYKIIQKLKYQNSTL